MKVAITRMDLDGPGLRRAASRSRDCESAGRAIEAGANAIVAESARFGSTDYAAAIASIREAHYPSDRKAQS